MAKTMPIEVLVHEVNLGLGATIRDGLYRAVQYSSKNDIIITMDADATHNPGLILRLIRMIIEGHDVVIASRFQSGGMSKMNVGRTIKNTLILIVKLFFVK